MVKLECDSPLRPPLLHTTCRASAKGCLFQGLVIRMTGSPPPPGMRF
uniref:Uncharacterized protein n=1 Tax=Tetraselmis sp. GSL018 TaxID=582737 RepID=A0A061QKH7_9CHLO